MAMIAITTSSSISVKAFAPERPEFTVLLVFVGKVITRDAPHPKGKELVFYPDKFGVSAQGVPFDEAGHEAVVGRGQSAFAGEIRGKF